MAIIGLLFMPLIFILAGALKARNTSDLTVPLVFMILGFVTVVAFLGFGVIKYTRRIRREEQTATIEENENKRRNMIVVYVC